jgi:hypothetical protein
MFHIYPVHFLSLLKNIFIPKGPRLLLNSPKYNLDEYFGIDVQYSPTNIQNFQNFQKPQSKAVKNF